MARKNKTKGIQVYVPAGSKAFKKSKKKEQGFQYPSFQQRFNVKANLIDLSKLKQGDF